QESKTTLIVNYIPQDMTDQTFRMMFEAVASLNNCKIVRHKPSGWSYGFGFVDYNTTEDAQKAIDKLNGFTIGNKVLKVAFSRPGGDNTKGANLYVCNIPKQLPEAEFRKAFEAYGNIVNCRLLRDKSTGLPKGCGFVLYDKKAEAQAAISSLSGTFFPGSTMGLQIRYADDNSAKVRPPNNVPNFGQQMGGPGPIRPPANRFQARFNPMGGGPLPQQKMTHMNGNKSQAPPGCTLYVYNIGYDANQEGITALFAQCGIVNKVDIMWDWQRQQCKGFCFVTMATQEEAQNAIQTLNGFMYTNKPLQVSLYSKRF
ncbi:predicted protein, partial [Nematostella vectensis]